MPASPRASATGARTRAGALPTVLIIGAQKCGTSALHYYMDLHPEIRMSAPKELNYFRTGRSVGVVAEPADRRVLERMGGPRPSLADYRDHFDPAFAIRGEASPSYTAPWYPDAPALIAETIPEAKLIMLVRDPFEQIPSSWQHHTSLGHETRPLAEAINRGGLYVARLRYRAVLAPYLERFDHEQLLVLDQAELLNRRRETMRRVFAFVGADPDFDSPRMSRRRHVTAEKGARKRLLDRIQRSRLARPGFRLPQEVKWYVERAFASGPGADQVPGLDRSARALIADELGADAAWLASEFGIDTAGWMR